MVTGPRVYKPDNQPIEIILAPCSHCKILPTERDAEEAIKIEISRRRSCWYCRKIYGCAILVHEIDDSIARWVLQEKYYRTKRDPLVYLSISGGEVSPSIVSLSFPIHMECFLQLFPDSGFCHKDGQLDLKS